MGTPLMIESAPEWLVAEMPPGYQNRVAEIQRLSEELRDMNRFGGLLWRVGDELAESAYDAFVALGFETERTGGASTPSLTVKLDGRRRLLLHVSASRVPVPKKDADVARVFQVVHESVDAGDRAVLVVNTDADVRPSERRDPLEPEALALLTRLGVNAIGGAALFELWSLSLKDKTRARTLVERLHEQDGGRFTLPAATAR